MIRGAIFDVDGTLLDSMPIWSDVGARYLRAIGMEPQPGLGDILMPLTLEEGAAYLQETYHLPQSREEIRSGVLGVIARFYREEAQLKPGMRELVEELSGKEISLALATTSDRELIIAALTRTGIFSRFQSLLTATELHTTKNQPLIYQEAARLLGTAPGETAVYEDAIHALRTAKAAGFYTIGVYDATAAAHWPEIQALADETIS